MACYGQSWQPQRKERGNAISCLENEVLVRDEEKKNILFDGHSNGVTYKSKW